MRKRAFGKSAARRVAAQAAVVPSDVEKTILHVDARSMLQDRRVEVATGDGTVRLWLAAEDHRWRGKSCGNGTEADLETGNGKAQGYGYGDGGSGVWE